MSLDGSSYQHGQMPQGSDGSNNSFSFVRAGQGQKAPQKSQMPSLYQLQSASPTAEQRRTSSWTWPDGRYTTCFTPTAGRTEEVEGDLAAIEEAESAEAPIEGMTEMELAVTSHHIFGTENEEFGMAAQERPTRAAETLRWILEEATTGTFDEEYRLLPYLCEVYRQVDKNGRTLMHMPKNPQETLTGPHAKEWRAAKDVELKALESRGTWVLVARGAVKGRMVLSKKWVLRLKTAADGTIEHFKARWVVRGYDQRHGIDFVQTFAPVSRHTSVRILLAIAAAKQLPLRQIEVKNTFLYVLVDATIFVEQPHTYGEGDPKLPNDPGTYRLHFNGDYILLSVYVNDPLYTGTCNKLLNQFEANLAQRVDITINHKVTQFMGLNITYAPEAIYLTSSLLTATGWLLFASVTCRPDLSYIANQLAQYSRKPVADNHLDLERALQYFISTPDIGLSYSTLTTTSFNLTGYVDADHAADPANRRSRNGFVFCLEPTGPISWNSQKQELVALPSAGA
ncbi:unnamed protein product [Closterium sp. NIES-53]